MLSEDNLFIPGPTYVSEGVRAAMGRQMIGHRSAAYADLQQRVVNLTRELFQTDGEVFLSSSSATGLMEGAIRCLVNKKSLHFVNGAFAERWQEIAESCGRTAVLIDIPWGQPVTTEVVGQALKDHPDAEVVCLTHNETSTGVLTPIAEIADLVHRESEALVLLDTVSSLGGVPVLVDQWGIDLCFASVQKCLALPPGFALLSASERAMQKAATVPGRGVYFDLLTMKKYNDKNNTYMTPSIPHIYALEYQLTRIMREETLQKRFDRHTAMVQQTQDWAKTTGLSYFSAQGFQSPTVSCLNNDHNWSIPSLISYLVQKTGMRIGGGYGRIKAETFRIGHMGDHSEAELTTLLDGITSFAANPVLR